MSTQNRIMDQLRMTPEQLSHLIQEIKTLPDGTHLECAALQLGILLVDEYAQYPTVGPLDINGRVFPHLGNILQDVEAAYARAYPKMKVNLHKATEGLLGVPFEDNPQKTPKTYLVHELRILCEIRKSPEKEFAAQSAQEEADTPAIV